LLPPVPVARRVVLSCVFVAAVLVAACASDRKKVDDANKAAASWAATVKAVTEQWAQSRVSLRFTRTTLNTATNDLDRQARSIRSIDAGAAARIDRLKSAIDPIRDAVALNEPDHARDAAKTMTSIMEPEPIAASARPQ
jgi:outer membrane murein-binding lipoprotein Lpp